MGTMMRSKVAATALLVMSCFMVNSFRMIPCMPSTISTKTNKAQLLKEHTMTSFNEIMLPRTIGTRLDMSSAPDGSDEEKVILGMQAKYFYAVCVLLFAFAYDFFVTHQGFKDGWVP